MLNAVKWIEVKPNFLQSVSVRIQVQDFSGCLRIAIQIRDQFLNKHVVLV